MGKLGVEWEAEELGGCAEDMAACFRGDGDVLEVDEAGGLEAVKDGFGCLELLGFVPVEEFFKVYQL